LLRLTVKLLEEREAGKSPDFPPDLGGEIFERLKDR